MKLSEVDVNKVAELTLEQKNKIVYGYKEDEASADVAILLGGKLPYVPKRAEKAAKLYFEGKVKYIVPTGGVEWEIDGEKISEALYMCRLLEEMGVPKEAVILENEARTTKENMIYATLQMNRVLRLSNVRSVMIVTSPGHLRRSMMIARLLLPRHLKIFGASADSEIESRDNWHKSQAIIERVDREVGLLKTYVDENFGEDIEF